MVGQEMEEYIGEVLENGLSRLGPSVNRNGAQCDRLFKKEAQERKKGAGKRGSVRETQNVRTVNPEAAP